MRSHPNVIQSVLSVRQPPLPIGRGLRSRPLSTLWGYSPRCFGNVHSFPRSSRFCSPPDQIIVHKGSSGKSFNRSRMSCSSILATNTYSLSWVFCQAMGIPRSCSIECFISLYSKFGIHARIGCESSFDNSILQRVASQSLSAVLVHVVLIRPERREAVCKRSICHRAANACLQDISQVADTLGNCLTRCASPLRSSYNSPQCRYL